MPPSNPTHANVRRGSLAERFDPQLNSLTAMRLGLAVTVAVVHAQALGTGTQPVVGSAQLGDLAVDAFFVISGFLVTRSATRLSSLRRFAWHRALRILPGFWVCLIVVALVAAPLIAALQGRPATAVFHGPESSLHYLARNAGVLIRQWDIAGLAEFAPDPAMNGSLWTLFYEAICYTVVGGLLAVGVLGNPRWAAHGSEIVMRIWRWTAQAVHLPGARRRALRRASRPLRNGAHALMASPVARHGTLILTAVVWACDTAQAAGWLSIGHETLLGLLLLFLWGALAHIYAGRVRFPRAALTVAVAALAVALSVSPNYRPLGAPALAYLVIWAAVGLPITWTPATDLSYGIYVYHWPVWLVLSVGNVAQHNLALHIVLGLMITVALAAASWRLVEAPALRLKDARWVDRSTHRPLPTA